MVKRETVTALEEAINSQVFLTWLAVAVSPSGAIKQIPSH